MIFKIIYFLKFFYHYNNIKKIILIYKINKKKNNKMIKKLSDQSQQSIFDATKLSNGSLRRY